METFINIFKGLFVLKEFEDYFLLALVVLCLFALLFAAYSVFSLIFEEIYDIINFFGRPLKKNVGEIISFETINGVTVPAGRGVSIPDMYILSIKIKEQNADIIAETFVTKKFYEEVGEGQKFEIIYIIGRFSKSVQIKELLDIVS